MSKNILGSVVIMCTYSNVFVSQSGPSSQIGNIAQMGNTFPN